MSRHMAHIHTYLRHMCTHMHTHTHPSFSQARSLAEPCFTPVPTWLNSDTLETVPAPGAGSMRGHTFYTKTTVLTALSRGVMVEKAKH